MDLFSKLNSSAVQGVFILAFPQSWAADLDDVSSMEFEKTSAKSVEGLRFVRMAEGNITAKSVLDQCFASMGNARYTAMIVVGLASVDMALERTGVKSATAQISASMADKSNRVENAVALHTAHMANGRRRVVNVVAQISARMARTNMVAENATIANVTLRDVHGSDINFLEHHRSCVTCAQNIQEIQRLAPKQKK